jgi:NADPH:quinone reductase-like Zn-dependent oxidoreductase
MCSTGKLDLVRSLGAADVIDYTREGLGDRKWDLIVDTAGRRSFAELRRALEPRGTLVIVGGEGGNRWTGGFLERMAGTALLSRSAGQRLVSLTATVNLPDLLALKELVEAGKLRPIIGRRYPLERSAEAVVAIEREHAAGKNVVEVS